MSSGTALCIHQGDFRLGEIRVKKFTEKEHRGLLTRCCASPREALVLGDPGNGLVGPKGVVPVLSELIHGNG